jgi:serine phosphatase RsbU (regulator of sigma subunit)
MVTEMLSEVQAFSRVEQHDDITLLVAKCRNHISGDNEIDSK